MAHFTQVRFKNYKAFSSYLIHLREFNVLVGPNNSGKSTVLGVFRILAEGIRKARAKSPVLVEGPSGPTWGHSISLSGLPVSTENVFHNYDESEPATVTFSISNENELTLYFKEKGTCLLLMNAAGTIRTPSDFKRQFPVTVAFVPVLGPVEHDEQLYQEEAARLALLSHSASRNFRNIWYHLPEEFENFRKAIQQTWPGMDIQKPEIDRSWGKPRLHMFCPEERYPREIFWAGFGFQVWCQMLTFLMQAKKATLLIVDEPDIYLHADLQRQLVGLLKKLGPDIVLATHSTEIISEVEPDSLLNINKRYRTARRIKDTHELQNVFQFLGSNLNPILTQLAKTKRAVFVEGKDFQIFSKFARKLGYEEVANRSDFAVVAAEGFNPLKVKDFSQGIEATLGTKLIKGVIFDRDYRSLGETEVILKELRKHCAYAAIHSCKELENYLLNPVAIKKAIEIRLAERKKRGESVKTFSADVESLLQEITDGMKNRVAAQYVPRRKNFEKKADPSIDETTLTEQAMNEFDQQWNDLSQRIKLAPGKEVFAALNNELQKRAGIHLTSAQIIDAFEEKEVPEEMVEIIKNLEDLRKRKTADDED